MRSAVPKLTLVGAGPGDAELLTLKGVRVLEQADAVLYDDLANRSLLAYAPAHAHRYYVGKRAGQPSTPQTVINELIVELAHEVGHVVRLKGGDSFVFGRGYEEIDYARRHGLICDIVPGISSCIAVPASQGIPVTSRGVSESFWVITGTTRSGELSSDLPLAAQSNATVVVLMGLSKLTELCQLYRQFGRDHLPMAVIQNGTRPDERCVVGQVWNMPQLVAEQGVGAPAVLIVGEVVALHPAYVTEYALGLMQAC
ncbi:uroporphyrinogen-III C-methyltransferase [Fibrella forsythiae]|uniref:uroporphyrinogen-III C-methyltransferase n=1 Tax=Fibrella forsythiae TaxID=2817061 RepID=A0ABS3JCF0_9BACT|nr:uroporphyrinogen-III C-methyltransferase [Fibrella forsythiae]MBO0947681.1 uroporphyrinogen-III C-methyltransferase [Fibrella forsythiae]